MASFCIFSMSYPSHFPFENTAPSFPNNNAGNTKNWEGLSMQAPSTGLLD